MLNDIDFACATCCCSDAAKAAGCDASAAALVTAAVWARSTGRPGAGRSARVGFDSQRLSYLSRAVRVRYINRTCVCSKEFAGGVHLPLDYERVAVGAIADKASIFKSAVQALPVVTIRSHARSPA